MSNSAITNQQAGPTSFTVRGTPLLSSGQTMALLARTPRFWVHSKVYAGGGENGMHAHADEDHMFFILAGEATFTHPDGTKNVVHANDGLMLPRGAAYSFQSTGDTNLVLLRIGCDATDAVVDAAVDSEDDVDQMSNPFPRAQAVRVKPDGVKFPPTSADNRSGAAEGVPVPSAFFGQ